MPVQCETAFVPIENSGSTLKFFDAKTIFFLGLLVAASGIVCAPAALVGGIAFGFTIEHPYRREASALAKILLQISVVALGFAMDLHQVLRAGRSGFVYTAISIILAMTLGLLLGKAFRVGGKASFLITAGTAICGGSAIAALAPITDAKEEEISVSMGTVFLLNSIALLVFPAIGSALHLNQNQFGLWAALAIHDTSSVVGATAKYGNQALAIGTTVKLTRALWIIPLSLLTAVYIGRATVHATPHERSSTSGSRIKIPWFILLFLLATVIATYVPVLAPAYRGISHLGKAGLTATLFLIGTSLSRRTLREVGVRPLLQGVVLWIVVATVSLAAIYFNVIAV